jgi:hypothetical protein
VTASSGSSGSTLRPPVPSLASKGLTTSAWTTTANAACVSYAKELPPDGTGGTPAMKQSRIRDRAWAITGRLRGLPRGSNQTEAFVTLLFQVGQQSDWLIQQYLNPDADKTAVAVAKAKRDAQLSAWYAQAKQLGTENCASIMRAA